MTKLLPPPKSEPSPSISSSSSSASVVDIRSPQISQQEEEWKKALKNLERRIQLYQEARAAGGPVSERAEDVAAAMEQVADKHTDPNVKKHWKEKAKTFRAAKNDDERDGILEDIGKGFLKLLITPFVLVGAVLQAVGGILSGVGSILGGMGKMTRKLVAYTEAPKEEPAVQTNRRRQRGPKPA